MSLCSLDSPLPAAATLSGLHRLVRLYALGLFLWLGVVWAGHSTIQWPVWTPRQLELLAIALALFAFAPLRHRLAAAITVLRDPAPRTRRLITLGVFIAAAAYLLATALLQGRDFFPKYHDEFMHLTEAQLVAHGNLWLPQHPLADFFETFHVLVKPVYCGIHFPGVALLYAPAIWLHLPTWLGPLLVAAAGAALLYRVIAQLLDGCSALLAVLLLLSLDQFRFISLMVMSNSVTLALGLGMVWAYLHWCERHSVGWALSLGVLAGWCAITRPPDAFCFAIPLGIAMAWDLKKDPGHARGYIKRCARTAIVLIAGAVPFLAVQIVFDLGVTGKPFLTPYSVYADAFNPGVNYGFRDRTPAARPATDLPQKQIYYTTFVLPNLEQHTPALVLPMAVQVRLPLMFKSTLPASVLLLLIPAGVAWLLRSRRGWVLAAALPLYFLIYTFQAMIAPFYVLFAAPAALLLVLAGAREIEAEAPPAARPAIAVGLTLFVTAMALAALPEVQGHPIDQYAMPTRVAARDALAHVQAPAIVLFRYRPGDNLHEEMVYNIDAPNPDDASIIHAQDLGPRNIELFRYYAQTQPQRQVYLFDRRERTLAYLGRVTDLAVPAR